MELWIGREFSKFAFRRYRNSGAESGEEFREAHLVPTLERAISKGDTLNVVIDVSCSGAFLHEAFSKLSMHGFSRIQVRQHLATIANEAHLECYSILAIRYLQEGYDAQAGQLIRGS